MEKKGGKKRKILKKENMSMLIGVLIILVMISLLKNTIIIDALEAKSMNLNFIMSDVFHPPEEISPGVYRINKAKGLRNDVVIFGFDEKSLEELGRYPWPRTVYAQFLENVNSQEENRPKGVLIDVLFTEYSQDRSADLALAAALGTYRENTVIDFFADVERQRPKASDEMKRRIEKLERLGIPEDDNYEQFVNVVTPPINEIMDSGVIIGPATALPGLNPKLSTRGTDKTTRRVAMVVKIKDRYYPSPPLWLAMLHYGVGIEDVEVNMGKHVILKNATIPASESALSHRQDMFIPIDEQGALLVNFYGSQGSFQVRSFSDVVEGRIGNRYFRGKVILAGVYAEGIGDVHQVPYGNMFGIEMIANAVTQLLNRDFITLSSDSITILLILFFGLLISYIVGRKSILLSYIAIMALSVIYFFTVIIVFDSYRYVLNLSAPLITAILTLFTMIVYRILTEEKEKKKIKGMFSNYVDESIVEELLKHPEKLELGGEDKEITVLFSDIRGFTTLSEKLKEPQKVVAHLNQYLSAMTDVIFKYKGTLDKYVGDEIMAFWNAPIEQEHHAEFACRSALEMMERLRALNEGWPDELKLDIGIGLNTGIMTVGNMGSKSRMDYTLMGDNVNLGARLEGTNKNYGTNIIISEFTHDIIKESFICRELDYVRVKGKLKPVKIYEIMDFTGETVAV